jgi:D-glycero-D-manno-heptose 1,7-bisphosphate phosphatase
LARRAVFLDRDGVILRCYIEDGTPRPARSVEEFAYLPRVGGALDLLRGAGMLLVVVTNQPDVARGLTPRSLVEAFHERLRRELGLTHIYTCFHDDRDGCRCRKPNPGLLERAAADLDISLPASFMVGDRWRDIEAGRRAGCTTILVREAYSGGVQPDVEVPSLFAAAEHIVRAIGPLAGC